jgi:SSS family solute:Na+ symporter
VTIVVSLFTKAKPDAQLRGLVYSLTDKPKTGQGRWYGNPMILGLIVLAMTLVLNLIFA